jgi:hypothetical protein
MRAYRREHGIPVSDVAALLHRSGECNCGAYIAADQRHDIEQLFPDWLESTIRPLEAEARRRGITRCIWGERNDTARLAALELDDAPMCSDCQLSLDEAPA